VSLQPQPNLEKEVRDGRFRQDLWYRINVFPITLPPLRQRKEDVPLLAHVFAAKFAKSLANASRPFPKGDGLTARVFLAGNIRELENVIERAVIFQEVLCSSDRQVVASKAFEVKRIS